ncbi:MAG: sensor histidine kinase [Minisyncoccota bacterium]
METNRSEEELKELFAEQKRSAQLLVRRDLGLMRANEKLHALDVQKSKFISVAAHQLRTPLSAIRWSLGLLLSNHAGKISEEQEALVRQAYESTVHLVRLVNDLLEVDRMEGGRTPLTFMPVDLHDVAKSVLADVAQDAERRGVLITLEDRLSAGARVTADITQLRVALQNVVENAVKYTRTGGSVTITLAEDGDKLSVSVKDTGIGIPADQQEQIFKQFFRARNAVKVETEGSGLGLSLTQEVLERMEGTISFTSEEDKGTTFVLTLPKATQ